MECLFAEEVSLVEVPDELLLLGAVLLLRDLDLQQQAADSEMRAGLKFCNHNYRVTHHLESYLLLSSKQNLCYSAGTSFMMSTKKYDSR